MVIASCQGGGRGKGKDAVNLNPKEDHVEEEWLSSSNCARKYTISTSNIYYSTFNH